MPTPAVIEKVRQLRAELANTRPDAPTLQSLKQHLDTVLVEPLDVPKYHGLKERLRGAYAGFENEHPTLAASMQTVINELTVAGL